MGKSVESSLIHDKLSRGAGITYLNDEIQHHPPWQPNSLKSLHLGRHVGVGFRKRGVRLSIRLPRGLMGGLRVRTRARCRWLHMCVSVK